MKIGIVHIAIICLLSWCTGCSDKDAALPHDGERPDIVFRLRVAPDGGGSMAADDGTSPGHTIESTIDWLHLFIVPVEPMAGGTNDENWNKVVYQRVWASEATAPNTFRVPIGKMPSGNVNIYVGANMNNEQVVALCGTPDHSFYVKPEGNLVRYYAAINLFAPFITNTEYDRNPKNIVMFSKEVLPVEDLPGKLKQADGQWVADIGTVALKRVVAKVLTTCVTVQGKAEGNSQQGIAPGAEPGIGYVPLANELLGNKDNEPKGWIRQQDVYYFINNMPRGLVFVQHYLDKDGDGINESLSPTYNLRDRLDALVNNLTALEFDHDEVAKYYIHYDQLELFQNNKSFQQSSVWNQGEYDELMNNPTQSEYNKEKVGMYTLENVFGVKDGDFTDNELAQLRNYEALPLITHVSIAAKFTPRSIFVTKEEWENGKNSYGPMKDQPMIGETDKTIKDFVTKTSGEQTYYHLVCHNEAVARQILTSSLEMHKKLLPENEEYDPNNNPGMYPPETYFAYFGTNENFFCSYGAASLGTTDDKTGVLEEMVPYTRGWSYYYTYINNEEEGPVTSIKQSCVERNTYYILTVKSIGTLGTSVSDPKYMKVHTSKSHWRDGGSGDITLQ